MSMPSLVYEAVVADRLPLRQRVRDYVELTKPRIAVMELIAVAAAGYIAAWKQPDPWLLLHAVIGTGLVAASASTWNQWLEREVDARMPRTADRPLASGRISTTEALWFGTLSALAGVAYLLLTTSLVTTMLAAACWVFYVCIYTPLKTRTPFNTVVGAVAGALPILIGWSAVGGALNLRAATLFLILFLWQFPHFMAIAWLYREHYAVAGMKMLPVVDPTGRRAGRQALVAALALLPVSLLPALIHYSGTTYFALALLLGLWQCVASALFWIYRTERTARHLLRCSLVYLPMILLLLMAC